MIAPPRMRLSPCTRTRRRLVSGSLKMLQYLQEQCQKILRPLTTAIAHCHHPDRLEAFSNSICEKLESGDTQARKATCDPSSPTSRSVTTRFGSWATKQRSPRSSPAVRSNPTMFVVLYANGTPFAGGTEGYITQRTGQKQPARFAKCRSYTASGYLPAPNPPGIAILIAT
jgi:hypothetical protein